MRLGLPSLQGVYDHSTPGGPHIILDFTVGGLTIQDESGGLGTDLFTVEDDLSGLILGVDVSDVELGVDLNMGGNTVYGDDQASGNLVMYSTSHATRGLISLVAETLAGGDCKIDLSKYYFSTYDLDIPEIIPRDNVRSSGASVAPGLFVQSSFAVRHPTGNPLITLYNSDLSVSASLTLNVSTGVVSVSGTRWTFANAPSAPGGSGSEQWGQGASAAGASSTAIGYNANASGGSAFAGGGNSLASGYGSFAIGNSSNGTQTGASAIGWNAKATAQGAFAMGALTQVSGANSLGIAYIGSVTGASAIALGSFTNVSFNYSIALGTGAIVTKVNQFVIGSSSAAIVEVVFGNGVTHTAPQAQTLLTTTSGSGTDIAGTNFVIQPGAGTGAGAGGDFILKTATPGASGSTLNTYTTALTIDDQQKALFAGEVEIDGDLNHDGSNVGFYGTAPVAQASAYTQTYATATKTHAARTAPGAGTGSGADATTFSGAECDALVADQQNTAQVLNQLIDDLQALGLIT